jgi:catalase
MKHITNSGGKTARGIIIALAILAGPTGAKAQQTPTQSTPQQMVDALHGVFGKHPNARAVHAKGVILEGNFIPAPGASKITKAKNFQRGAIPIMVRFSDFTGIPDIPDTAGLANPRGFAIKFLLPDQSSTDIVCHSFNGFPVATTDEFRELLTAIAASKNGVAPTPLDRFLETHPIAKDFFTHQKPAPVSYATLSYFGVNSFQFTNASGDTSFIRYQFVPQGGERFLTKQQLSQSGPDYLVNEIKARVGKSPVKFKMYAQIAAPGDKTGDPSIAWSDKNKRVLLGTVVIEKLNANTLEEDKKLSFIPNNLVDGIEAADPMLTDRSKAYPISVKERREDKQN